MSEAADQAEAKGIGAIKINFERIRNRFVPKYWRAAPEAKRVK